MKKVLSILPVSSSSIGHPWGGRVRDAGGWNWLELEPEDKRHIVRIGCRIEKVEPKETYTMFSFFDAMIPGYKGDHQDGWGWSSFLTCSCGHGGCAGYHDNVRIHRKKKVVRVSGRRRDGYRNGVVDTGEQVVYFDKVQWDALLAYYMNLFRKNPEGIFQMNEFYFTGKYGVEYWSK